MKRLISTFFFATAVCWQASAQATLFNESQTVSVEINGDNRSDDGLLDIVFADGGDRLLTYKLDLESRITRIGGQLLITIDNRGFKSNNDCKYKGFSINSVLRPEVFSAEFVLLSGAGSEVKRWTVDNEPFEPEKNMVRHYYVEEEPLTGCKLRIVSVELHFNKSGVREADEFISLIDDYYNTDARLKMMEQELAAIRPDSIETLEQARQFTINNTAVINDIKSRHFDTKLDLSAYNPIDLMEHLRQAEQTNRNVKKQVEYALSHMWETYHNKGMELLGWGKGDRAEEMFINSIKAKTNYAPPHYQLASMDYESGLYRQVLDTCARIVTDMNPDSDTRYNTIKLAERVIYIFIDSVSQFIDNKDVDNGFRVLSVCKDYCKRIKGIRRFEEFDKLSAQLYGAIHAKLIAEAQTYYDAKDLKQSTLLADSAANLRAEYPTFDIDAKAESKLLNDLYLAWIAYGKSVSMDKPDEALFAFDQATHICRKHTAVSCSAELEKLAFDSRTHKYMRMLEEAKSSLDDGYPDSALEQLDEAEKYRQTWDLKKIALADELRTEAYQQKYDGLMAEGDNALARKQPREALAFYAAALAINKEQPIMADTAWTTKNRNASIMYVVNLCGLGISYVEMFQMGKAGQQYQKALAVAEDAKITKVAEVQTALSDLSAALSDGECSQAWFDYNVQVGAAERLIKQKEFIKARTSLSKAAGIARANYKCNLTDSVVQERSKDIETICEYEKMVNSVQPMLEQKEFAKALETYVAATEFFTDSCNNKFGIRHKAVYDYVFENQYGGLVDAAVVYYAEINELKKSLNLLNELNRRYYESMWTRESQEKLGIELARRDFREHPSADPKVKVLDYTRGDKWYNGLRKAYQQEWIDNSVENLKDDKSSAKSKKQ
ncbi:MAG: hypothetical protein IKN94_08515 [Salinivirgaceae bacterium]|nr:hypothetical protein [Salinivirgaceae bacterium]